jgi:hypothetical protein
MLDNVIRCVFVKIYIYKKIENNIILIYFKKKKNVISIVILYTH